MNYDYYLLEIKFTRKMLATCSSVSIWKEHIIEKARKMIAKANTV